MRHALERTTVRIAILAPPWFAVPPTGYGGIEWIVWLLADGLAGRGHDVTLFASGDSRTKAKLEAIFEHAPSELIGRAVPELRHVLSCYERSEDFDPVRRSPSLEWMINYLESFDRLGTNGRMDLRDK